MGYSKKEEIAKLRRERKEAKAAKKRKENIREKLVRFHIVCEGTKSAELSANNYVAHYNEEKCKCDNEDRNNQINAIIIFLKVGTHFGTDNKIIPVTLIFINTKVVAIRTAE